MTTPIEVIDTAVKIGLGALISGLATYLVTRAKNKHDIAKLLLEDNRKTLREIAENIEESIALLNDFIHLAYGEREEAIDRMQASSASLMESHKKASRAETLANLMGLTELASAIDQYCDPIKKLHELIAENIKGFNHDQANNLVQVLNKKQELIAPLISDAYSKLSA